MSSREERAPEFRGGADEGATGSTEKETRGAAGTPSTGGMTMEKDYKEASLTPGTSRQQTGMGTRETAEVEGRERMGREAQAAAVGERAGMAARREREEAGPSREGMTMEKDYKEASLTPGVSRQEAGMGQEKTAMRESGREMGRSATGAGMEAVECPACQRRIEAGSEKELSSELSEHMRASHAKEPYMTRKMEEMKNK